MTPLLREPRVMLRWDPHSLRVMVHGDLDVVMVDRLLQHCLEHVDDAPFHRQVCDLSAVDDVDPLALRALAGAFQELKVAGVDAFFVMPDAAMRATLAIQACGSSEREVEAWVRRASARHRRTLAAVNAQAEAPRRWNLPSWGVGGWLSAGDAAS